jgi:hypothetical protein
MSALLKGRVECFETNTPIKEGVQDLEDLLLDMRSLKINRLIV